MAEGDPPSAVLPEGVRDDGYGGVVIGRGWEPADGRGEAEDFEVVAGDEFDFDAGGGVFGADVNDGGVGGEDAIEVGVVADVLIEGIAEGTALGTAIKPDQLGRG